MLSLKQHKLIHTYNTTHTHPPTHIHTQNTHTHTHTHKDLFFDQLFSTSANLQRPELKVACTIADAMLTYTDSCPSRIYFLKSQYFFWSY
jgi:hypothetical protein